jgi:hypothetical protein
MDDPALEAAVGGTDATGQANEALVRAFALPGALLVAWIVVKISPGIVRLITMWVHETGHAVAAWVCGYQAFPGPWFTPVTEERSLAFSLTVAALVVAGGYRAWQRRQKFWIAAAATALVLMLLGTLVVSVSSAQQLITFFGDGGNLVLGTLLMLTMYAPASSVLRKNQLRWGLLVIGALAFVDALTIWTGPIDQLPFGENDNGLSDPSMLTEQYGWTVQLLIDRYRQLSYFCLAAMGGAYLFQLFRKK